MTLNEVHKSLKDEFKEKFLKETGKGYFAIKTKNDYLVDDVLIKDLKSFLHSALISQLEETKKLIKERIIEDNQIIAETPEHKFGRGMVNSTLSDLLLTLQKEGELITKEK